MKPGEPFPLQLRRCEFGPSTDCCSALNSFQIGANILAKGSLSELCRSMFRSHHGDRSIAATRVVAIFRQHLVVASGF